MGSSKNLPERHELQWQTGAALADEFRHGTGDLPSNVFAYVRDPAEQDRLEKAAKRTLKYGALAIELKRK